MEKRQAIPRPSKFYRNATFFSRLYLCSNPDSVDTKWGSIDLKFNRAAPSLIACNGSYPGATVSFAVVFQKDFYRELMGGVLITVHLCGKVP